MSSYVLITEKQRDILGLHLGTRIKGNPVRARQDDNLITRLKSGEVCVWVGWFSPEQIATRRIFDDAVWEEISRKSYFFNYLKEDEMIDFEKTNEEEIDTNVAQEAAIKFGTALTTFDPFDLTKIKRDFAPYLANIEDMEKQAAALKIIDDKSASQATEMIAQSKRLFKKLEDERKKDIAKHSDFVDKVNGFVKMFTVALKGIPVTIGREQVRYQNIVETNRREAEAKAQAEAKKMQEKINKAAAKKGTEPVQVVIPVTVEKSSIIRSETGASTSFRKEWKVKVIEGKENEVDRLFCSPDLKKLQEAVDTGIREIAGCEVFEKVTPVTRS